ncbi:MAG: tetratricopeptide repeat protein [Bdellovibrionales bacterium]
MTYEFQAKRSKNIVAVAAVAGFAAMLASPVCAKTKSSVSETTASQEADLRLALDKVQLDAQSGKMDQAQALLEKLKAKYPNNPDVLAVEADLNDQLSSRATRLSELCMPNSLDPNNNDLLMYEREHGRRNNNYACGGYNRRLTPQGVEQISNISGQVSLTPSISVIADFENNHLNTKQPFTRADGNTNSFYGNRKQATVTLQKTFTNRDQVGVSVYGTEYNAGGGVQYVHRDRTGGTAILVNYQQPNWDYVEMVVDGGTKSNVRLERKQVFNPNLQAALGVSYNQYSMNRLWSAADGPGWDFNLDYARPIRIFNQGENDPSWISDEFYLGAHYSAQAEYFLSVARRTDSDGDTFNPLTATTYEVHSLTGSIGKTLLKNVEAQIEGGYGVDRIRGDNGPIYGGTLTYSPIEHLGLDVHAARTLLGGENNGQKQDLVGASVKWVW